MIKLNSACFVRFPSVTDSFAGIRMYTSIYVLPSSEECLTEMNAAHFSYCIVCMYVGYRYFHFLLWRKGWKRRVVPTVGNISKAIRKSKITMDYYFD